MSYKNVYWHPSFDFHIKIFLETTEPMQVNHTWLGRSHFKFISNNPVLHSIQWEDNTVSTLFLGKMSSNITADAWQWVVQYVLSRFSCRGVKILKFSTCPGQVMRKSYLSVQNISCPYLMFFFSKSFTLKINPIKIIFRSLHLLIFLPLKPKKV